MNFDNFCKYNFFKFSKMLKLFLKNIFLNLITKFCAGAIITQVLNFGYSHGVRLGHTIEDDANRIRSFNFY